MKNIQLEGIRLVDRSHLVVGPSCTVISGDMGADVVKK